MKNGVETIYVFSSQKRMNGTVKRIKNLEDYALVHYEQENQDS